MSGSEGLPVLGLTMGGSSTLLRPVVFQATEAISRPFKVTVEMVSDQSSIDQDSVLYKPACLSVVRQNNGTRYFNGVVSSFSGKGTPVRSKWRYTATIAPRLWFMEQTTDCRIFQQTSVSDIVSARCGEVSQSFSDVTQAKPTREYVTQYNETDLDFLHRLLEQEGYFYFFAHTEGDHVLTLCNQNQSFPASPKPTMHVVHEGGTPSTLTRWHKLRATTHGAVKTLDYDPTAPSTLPSGTSASTLQTSGGAARDVFRWPARRFSASDAGDLIDSSKIGIRNHERVFGSPMDAPAAPLGQTSAVSARRRFLAANGRVLASGRLAPLLGLAYSRRTDALSRVLSSPSAMAQLLSRSGVRRVAGVNR